MSHSVEKEGLALGQAAVYRIVVQGTLTERYRDRVGGLHLEIGPGLHGGSATTLTGSVRDQSQLIGVLNTLYEMRLPILGLELLEID